VTAQAASAIFVLATMPTALKADRLPAFAVGHRQRDQERRDVGPPARPSPSGEQARRSGSPQAGRRQRARDREDRPNPAWSPRASRATPPPRVEVPLTSASANSRGDAGQRHEELDREALDRRSAPPPERFAPGQGERQRATLTRGAGNDDRGDEAISETWAAVTALTSRGVAVPIRSLVPAEKSP
jgi:hypothetical protein